MADNSRYQSYALGVLRIVSALLFMQDGAEKLFQFPQPAPLVSPFESTVLMHLTGALEMFGGLHILLGITTRITAIVLAAYMAVTYWAAHFLPALDTHNGIFPSVNGGDRPLLFLFLYLYLLIAGPGAWSLDEVVDRLRKRRLSRKPG